MEGLLLRVWGWRAQRGPRREHYAAYRRFCARRARRLRRRAALSLPRRFCKSAYNKVCRPASGTAPEEAAALLESGLLRVEKRLATQWEAQRRPGSISSRLLRRRLIRANSIAKSLEADFHVYLTTRAKLELRAYAAAASSALLLHCGKLAEAKNPLQLQIEAFRALTENCPAVEKAALEDLAGNAVQALRHCRFQLREFGAEPPPALRHVADLAQLLDHLQAENHSSTGAELINWPVEERIDDQRTATQLRRLAQCQAELATRVDPLDLLFWETINAADEAASAANRARMEAGPVLDKAFVGLLAFLTRERELLLLRRALRSLTADSLRSIEAVLAPLRALIEVHAHHGNSVPLLLLMEVTLRGRKCALLAELFRTRGKPLAALSLLAVAKGLITHASSSDWESAADKATSLDQRARLAGESSLVEHANLLRGDLTSLASRLALTDKQARVALMDEQQRRLAALTTDVAAMTVSRDPEKTVGVLDLLLRESEACDGKPLEWVTPLVSASMTSLSTSPLLLPLPEYPDLPTREKQGFFSRLFGFK